MRRFLFPVLILGLMTGCSVPKIGPHRIDVQQGNALDQENVARLKPGLNRAQVRFLLGTPLLVDPFRNDRWDYVYVFYKAGKLAEQKRISLFFEGDTLARIEGELPDARPAEPPAVPASPAGPASQTPAATGMPLASDAPVARPLEAESKPVGPQPAAVTVAPGQDAPDVRIAPRSPAPPAPAFAPRTDVPSTTVVPPMPSPRNAPAYVDPRRPAEPGLQVETDVTRIQPDVIPSFPEPASEASSDDIVLKVVADWAVAWSARDEDAYLAAYDSSFVPQGGGSRADWEKRRRLLLGVANNIEVKLDSPSVERTEDGATVTFNQFYRSDSYRDAVVKQLRLIEREGRWLIVEEKVLSILGGARP
ncbi:MAG: outer membrane protein assembly factor BamE [Pseudomonadota bacterium]